MGLGAAMAQQPAVTDAAASTNPISGAWRIVQARTEPMIDMRRASLDFGPEGRLSGHTSCGALMGSYTLVGERLSVGKITTAVVACAQLQLEQEDRVLSALEVATTARVRSDGLLELRDADGRGVLRATRFDGPPR